MTNFRCTECLFESQWIFLVKEHVRKHYFAFRGRTFACSTQIGKYKCRTCHYQTDTRVRYFQHLYIQHNYIANCDDDKDMRIRIEEGNNKNKNKFVEMKRDIYFYANNYLNAIWKCSLCPFETKRKEYLKIHEYRQHSPEDAVKWFKCTHCTFKTMVKSKLSVHIERKHMSAHLGNWHYCPHCLIYRTRAASDLKIHILHRHTPDDQVRWFLCEYCSYRCKIRGDLNKHIARKHCSEDSIKWYECPHCLTHKSKALGDLKQHILRKHTPDDQVSWFNCIYCPFKSKVRRALTIHLKTRHQIEIPVQSALAKNRYNNPKLFVEIGPWLECQLCPYKSKKKCNLDRHIEKKHLLEEGPERILGCPLCDFKTKIYNNLKIHKIRKHLPDDQIQWITCPYCPHKAKFQRDLSRHIHRKHNEKGKSFECPHCHTYKSGTSADLKSHILHIHTPHSQIKRWFVCPFCTYQALKSYQLKRHLMSIHKSFDTTNVNMHDYAVIRDTKLKEPEIISDRSLSS